VPGEVRLLDGMPSLPALYGRAGLAAVPGVGLLGRLPLLPGPRRPGLPPEGLGVTGAGTDPRALSGYCRVCGLTLRNEIPATWPHVLSFPLQMALMSSGSFPFPLIGLVHLDNEITQHRPIGIGERLDFEVRAADLRPHPKGRAFSLLVVARVGEEVVWEERGTILHRGGAEPGAEPGPVPKGPGADAPDSAEWRLRGDLGRRYAAVSGDRNPIHLHPLAARALGFPRPIAHGMWTKARSLAQLEGRIPPAFRVAVAFRRPVLLPGVVRFAAAERTRGVAFAVRGRGEGAPHLVGELAPPG
jgi:acyl dehydratase